MNPLVITPARRILWRAVDASYRAIRGEQVAHPTRFQLLSLIRFGGVR